MEAVIDEKLIMNFVNILETKNNFKTHIHCLDMITLAVEKINLSNICQTLPILLIQRYIYMAEGNYDFMETRYLPNLKHSIMKLLLILLDKLNFEKDKSCYIKIITTFPQKFLAMLNSYLYSAVKDLQGDKVSELEKITPEEFKNKMQIISTDSSKSNTNIDDLMVKGNQSKTMVIDCKRLNADETLKEIKEKITITRNCSKTLVQLVDDIEELQLPFLFYDGFKQIAELQLDDSKVYELPAYDLL